MGLPSIFQQPLPRVLSQIHIHASLNNPSEGSVKLASNNPSEQIKQPLRELNPLFDPSGGLVEGRFETGPPVRGPSTNPSEQINSKNGFRAGTWNTPGATFLRPASKTLGSVG